MRWYHFSLIYLLAAVALVWFPAAMAAPDTVTFHRFSMSGPVVTSFNDGETVYVNASDGVSSGGSVNYIVIDGNGTYHNLTLWDNGNQADETPHDGYYAGRFTIYETRVPGVPFPKIQYNNSSNGTVIVDLDLGGDGTVANFTASYSNFTLYLVRVISFSPYIYFDNVTDTLYFSNDQNMSDNLTVVLRDNKPGAWGKECTGETAFGSTPTDTDYSDRQWDLNYTVDTNETCNSKIMFTVQDRAGYRAYYNLTVVLDNDGPTVDSLAISTFPDYIGPTYRWWRPQGLIWGLNVTWNNVDTGAGLGGGALDWNATVDAYDQFGIDCGADGHENVGGLDDDGSCRIDITVTIRDHVNNTGSDTYSIMFDADAPNITVLNVTENSDNIYYNGTLLYSNDQIMADPFEFVIFDDENGSGRRNASGSSAFGDTPSDNDYTGGWNLQYIVHTGETSGPISLYVFDNVGNMATTVVPTVLDNNDPLIDGDVTEDSPYLHLDGILYFGDDMTGVENATFSGGARDDIGLWKIEFSQEPNLASSPATPVLLNGTVDFWNASYGFDSSSTPGDGWIVIRVYDLVGNSDHMAQRYIRDTTAPTFVLENYRDGRIVRDGDAMVEYTNPWTLRASVTVTDDLTSLYRVNVSIDDVPASAWTEPPGGVFNVTDASLNLTGWHVITWTAIDHVNNTRTNDTSILRSPNATTNPFRRQMTGDQNLVNAAVDTTYGATIDMSVSQTLWAGVMEYPYNPITGLPAGNYSLDPNVNYTTFHYLDIGVNRTSFLTSVTIRIYFTEAELYYLSLDKEAIIGVARWDGIDWNWFTSSAVSRINVTVGGIGYAGYVEVTLTGLYSRSNILCVAGWRHRVNIRSTLNPTNLTIFASSLYHSYTRHYAIVFRNIGAAADDYYVNASGPNDWNITWDPAVANWRHNVKSLPAGRNLTVDLYVTIPIGATNVSAEGTGAGRAYTITVTVASMTDTRSTLNPWMNDTLDLTAFIRRTDLEVSAIEFDRYSYLPDQPITVYVAVSNHGNYTTSNVTLTVRMTVGTDTTVLGTTTIPPISLEPLQTVWATYQAEAVGTPNVDVVINATVAYGGDEYDVEPNRLSESVEVHETSTANAATGLPLMGLFLVAALVIALDRHRERDLP